MGILEWRDKEALPFYLGDKRIEKESFKMNS